MNWDAIGSIGEIIGAIAVVVSIVYLSTQVRSNTRATRATAGFEAAHSWAGTNEAVLTLDQDFKSRLIESCSPDSTWNDFTPEERRDISVFHRALFQKLEGQYFLLKYGVLDEGIWVKRSRWAANLISLPFYKEWWQQEKNQLIYSDEFCQEIETIEGSPLQVAGVEDAAM